ncbi:MAG: DUF1453 family protein [Steroidobacteraceae bacterium]
MQALNPTTVTYLIAAPLIVWRMVVRVRRMIGRQHYSRVRPWITLSVFPLLLLWLAYVARTHAQALEALGAGLVLGVIMGILGLRHTRFEATPQGLYYTPNAHLGIALSAIFAARVLYRMIQLGGVTPGAAEPGSLYSGSPLTLAVFGLLAGYYVTYAIGLLRWAHGPRLPDHE